MALFNLQKISRLAANQPTYLRGISCYNGGFVRHTQRHTGGVYEEIFTAEVDTDDHAGVVHCEVCFDYQGEASSMSCSCATYRPDNGACKHIVAALAHKYYADMVGGSAGQAPTVHTALPDRTDTAAAHMIGRYMDQQAAYLTAVSSPPSPPIRLLPLLHIHGQHATLSCSVCGVKPYVIRDLRAFCQAVIDHESVSYGKDLTFYHHPDCFAAEDRGLLRFLIGQLPPSPRGTPGGHAVRELSLTPMALDSLFSLMKGRTLAYRDRTTESTATLSREDPVLTVNVIKEPQGCTLKVEDMPTSISGTKRRYVLQKGVLYGCSTAFSINVGPLLDALQTTHGRLYIAGKDLPALCMGALKAAGEHIRLVGDAAELERYLPQTPIPELYLDAPDHHTIAAKLLFCYGERRVNAFTEEELDGVTRDTLEEYRLRLLLKGDFEQASERDGRMLLKAGEEQLFRFVTDGIRRLGNDMTVYATDRVRAISVLPPPRISVGVRMQSDLLDITLTADDMSTQEMERLLESYREKRPYHRLKSGGFLRLSDPALQGLYALAAGMTAEGDAPFDGHATMPRYRALYLDRVLRDHPSIRLKRDEGFRRLIREFRAVADSDYSPPASLDGVLRNYQKTGFRWLKTLEQYGFGGILADEMGLGKTIQMISLLLDAKERSETRPSLVVCPASLVYNWQQEFARFAPTIKVVPIVGDPDTRRRLLAGITGGEVLITSYDLLKRDREEYEALSFAYHVLDEAQCIKNADTHTARAVKSISSAHRFALTGTPIENRLSELWSIFDFLMPGFLYSYTRFRETLERPIVQEGDEAALVRLNRLVKPFVMRRLKKDVLAELPPKHEAVVRVALEEEQRALYRANVVRLREELRQNGLSRNHITVLSMLTRLRRLCCSPQLCYEDYTGDSAKLEACMELLSQAIDGGHKVLIFSQFTSMLDLLAERLKKDGVVFYELRGSTTKEQRAVRVAAFNEDEVPVFLISLKAGGTGLNLTGADTVIHFDPWWNVSAQNQATDRAHRIGQTRTVQVYKLIAADTIEEKILRMQEQKQALADAVVHEGDGILSGMTVEDMLELLE